MKVIKSQVDTHVSPKIAAYRAGIEAGNAGMTENDAHYRSKLFDAHKDDFLRGYHEAKQQDNPRAYHGTHQDVTAFVSMPKRELRNYESIGTFVTTDKEHAKMFGKYIHQVDLPDTLKLYADHDRDDLRRPFLTPALDPKVKVLTVGEKKLLAAAFIAAPVNNDFFGMKSYEVVSSEFRALMRELDKDDTRRYKFFHRHPKVSAYVTKCESALESARDIERDKLFFNKDYALVLWDWYTSRGYDGIAWENTCMDAGFHDSNDRRQSQYLIFHPDKYAFSKVD